MEEVTIYMMPNRNLTIDRISNGTIWITGTEALKSSGRVLEKMTADDEGKLFVCKTNVEGIFTYGLEQTREKHWGHGPGYIWASRASCMNAAFGVTLYEAAYRVGNSCYQTCAVDLVRIEYLLKQNGYSVDFNPVVSEDGLDVDFKVTKD